MAAVVFFFYLRQCSLSFIGKKNGGESLKKSLIYFFVFEFQLKRWLNGKR